MCMDDFRLGRKIKTKSYNLGTATFTIPADARRVAVLAIPATQPDLARYFSLNVSNGDGTSACIWRSQLYTEPKPMDIRFYGQLIQGPINYVNESGVGNCSIVEFYLEDV